MQLNQLSTRVLYFGAPIAILIGIRFFVGGPQSSHASMTSSTLQRAELPDLSATIASENTKQSGRSVVESMQRQISPFWFDQRIEVVNPEYSMPEEPTEKYPSGPELSVSSILPHPARPLAVINGKPCKLGERVAPGWKLTAIDGNARTVTITNALGESRTIGISTP